MGSINNKINKPLVSIGFDKKGKITYNVDLNKTKKLNLENRNDLIAALNKMTRFIETSELQITSTNQQLAVVNDFCIRNNVKFEHLITLDNLMEVEVFIKNNSKLGAVKKFKEFAGCGLKDGKDFVEFYAEKIRHKFNYEKDHRFFYEIP